MTYLDLLRDADRQLDDGRITIGEYEQMIRPLECEVQPEVVRCGECNHSITYNVVKYVCCEMHNTYPNENYFCADAERRTDG